MAEAVTILREQESTKIIQLLEEMRRDSRHLIDRLDHVAHAMSASTDPQAVLDAIKNVHRELSS